MGTEQGRHALFTAQFMAAAVGLADREQIGARRRGERASELGLAHAGRAVEQDVDPLRLPVERAAEQPGEEGDVAVHRRKVIERQRRSLALAGERLDQPLGIMPAAREHVLEPPADVERHAAAMRHLDVEQAEFDRQAVAHHVARRERLGAGEQAGDARDILMRHFQRPAQLGDARVEGEREARLQHGALLRIEAEHGRDIARRQRQFVGQRIVRHGSDKRAEPRPAELALGRVFRLFPPRHRPEIGAVLLGPCEQRPAGAPILRQCRAQHRCQPPRRYRRRAHVIPIRSAWTQLWRRADHYRFRDYACRVVEPGRGATSASARFERRRA